MGLAIILSLTVAGVVLMRDLSEEAKLEQCLMSGRTNCDRSNRRYNASRNLSATFSRVR
jgi:hypothetical protein